MKLTMRQQEKHSSLENRTRLNTKSNASSIKNIMQKHYGEAYGILVQKCLHGISNNTFNEHIKHI